jgi:ABC-2 type transport system permease protein
MKTLRFLLEKEFKQIRRDKFLPRMILFLPIMQLIVLPFAANFEMNNINLTLIDNDHSIYSTRLTEKITSSGYFTLTGVHARYDEALKQIENNSADLVLEIPANFERRITKEGTSHVLIAANTVNGTKGGLGSSYLSNIIQSFNSEINAGQITVQSASVPQIDVQSTNLFNPHMSYKNYMVPGIMVFLLTIVGGSLSALNIVSEKEKGTIEQINVTPVPKYIFLLSKLIPFWVIGFVLLTLGAIVAWAVYGLTPLGGFGVIYLFAAVYMIAFTGFGLTISSVSESQHQAMFTAFFFIIIFNLMGGLFTPISSMPEWAQKLTWLNPLSYFVEVIRMVYLKGSQFADLTKQFGAVCLFAVVFNAMAIISYRKSS